MPGLSAQSGRRSRRRMAVLVVVVTAGFAVAGLPPTAASASSDATAKPGSTLTVTDQSGRHPVAAASVAGSAVLHYGDAPDEGSLLGSSINAPVVGMAGADAQGYWLVSSDGGVFSFGDARFQGSMGGQHLNQPIVGMASSPDGGGYWLVASDGGVFTFGDARFAGSTGNERLNKPVVGMATDASTGGYWLVASDGGIFSFNAPFHGSTGNIPLNKPVVGMAPAPGGAGYWLVASDGGVFTFGDAAFEGSAGATQLAQPVVAMAATPDGGGYWMAEGQPHNSPFTPAVVSAVAARGISVSATIRDLQTGATYEYQPGRPGVTASIMKVQILGTALAQAQAAGRGLTPAEQALAVPMIENSDNNAASALYNDDGGPGGVAAFDRSVGMSQTYPAPAWGTTTTTTDDQIILLDHLVEPNTVLTDASRDYELSLMHQVEPDQAWGVSAGVPPGVGIALKNGWLPVNGPWTVNSIGEIFGGGRHYLIAVMTSGSPTEQYGIDTISIIAGAAYAALGP